MKKLPLRLYNTETKKTDQFKTLGTQMGYPIAKKKSIMIIDNAFKVVNNHANKQSKLPIITQVQS